ncbi:reverse transcriptase domain-containing protein [Tanacetum coccineum]
MIATTITTPTIATTTTTKITATITTVTMITTNSRIGGKKPSRLILPTMGHLTWNCKNKGLATKNNLQPVSITCNACGEKGHYANQCSKANQQGTGERLTERQDCFCSFRIFTLETTLEDIQLAQFTYARIFEKPTS